MTDEKFAEQRRDKHTRMLWNHIDERFDLFEEEIKSKFENYVSYKALFGFLTGVAVSIIVGVLALFATTRSQVDVAKAEMSQKIGSVDTSLQQFKSETGSEVKGVYRFLLEKQRPDIVRQQVEEQKRETAPPLEPVNPLAPRKR